MYLGWSTIYSFNTYYWRPRATQLKPISKLMTSFSSYCSFCHSITLRCHLMLWSFREIRRQLSKNFLRNITGIHFGYRKGSVWLRGPYPASRHYHGGLHRVHAVDRVYWFGEITIKSLLIYNTGSAQKDQFCPGVRASMMVTCLCPKR